MKKPPFRQRRAIVLLSGGLDSAVTLYISKDEGFKPLGLIFDYGQRHHREIKSAKRIARSADCAWQVIKISLPWKGSSLLDKKTKLPITDYRLPIRVPSTYVPGRNTIFLSFAFSYAEAVSAEAIFIGAHSQDYSGYPDCRREFFKAYEEMIVYAGRNGSRDAGIRIRAPLISKNKAQIIKLGEKLGVPLGLTWSCYQGGKIPCGKCDSCYFRAKGFKEAGLKDPYEGKNF